MRRPRNWERSLDLFFGLLLLKENSPGAGRRQGPGAGRGLNPSIQGIFIRGAGNLRPVGTTVA